MIKKTLTYSSHKNIINFQNNSDLLEKKQDKCNVMIIRPINHMNLALT